MKKSILNEELLLAIFSIIIGIVFIVLRTEALNVTITIVGALLVIVGIVDIVQKKYRKGIILSIIGAVIIACSWIILDISLIGFGVCLVASALIELGADFNNKSIPEIISLIAEIIIGVLFVLTKWVLVDLIFIIIGSLSIIYGGYHLVKYLKK